MVIYRMVGKAIDRPPLRRTRPNILVIVPRKILCSEEKLRYGHGGEENQTLKQIEWERLRKETAKGVYKGKRARVCLNGYAWCPAQIGNA